MLVASSQPAGSANEDKPFDHILFYEPLFFGVFFQGALEKFTALQLLLTGQFPPANTVEAKPGLRASTSKQTPGRRERPHKINRKLSI